VSSFAVTLVKAALLGCNIIRVNVDLADQEFHEDYYLQGYGIILQGVSWLKFYSVHRIPLPVTQILDLMQNVTISRPGRSSADFSALSFSHNYHFHSEPKLHYRSSLLIKPFRISMCYHHPHPTWSSSFSPLLKQEKTRKDIKLDSI
jgi:hypothetical protein